MRVYKAPDILDVYALRQAYEGFDDHYITIHKAAKWYATNGFHIVPFRSKKPAGYPKGLSQHHATVSIDLVDEWWHPITGKYRGWTIAMAMGGGSGLCAIDLDSKDVDGIEVFADLVSVYGSWDEADNDIDTVSASTPSGGKHLLYKFHPEIISNSEVAFPGIDTRGGYKGDPQKNGGVIFVEPSTKPGVNGEYRWQTDRLSIADFPQWMADLLNNKKPAAPGKVSLQDSYVESAPGAHGDGRDRNIYIDILRHIGAGYTEDQIWDLKPQILERMDPPDERMVDEKIKSALGSDAFKEAEKRKDAVETTNSFGLITNKDGVPVKNVENLMRILESPVFAFKYGDIRYDDFYLHFTINDEPLASAVDWSVGVSRWISNTVRLDYGFEVVRKATEVAAYSKPHTNAARDYIMNCPVSVKGEENFWGSKRSGPGPAFERLCTEVLNFNNPRLHEGYSPHHGKVYRALLWFWLQGAVARACVPGSDVQMVLNIFGTQGIGKSRFFRDLCPEPTWFTDSIKDAVVDKSDNKDELAKLCGTLIVEMPELSPIKSQGKSGDERFKQFVSSQKDKYRAPYGKDSVDHPRTCVLAGSSNKRDLYRDLTGDRRFLSIDHGDSPIMVADYDNGVLEEIKPALWGELRDSFNEGELDKKPEHLLVCIPRDLRADQYSMNEAYRYEEIGILEILEWITDKTRVTWDEIVEQASTVPGLRDEKEYRIINMTRQHLQNESGWVFARRCVRKLPDGRSEKTNFWINNNHPDEHKKDIPEHWSRQYNHEKEY